jgi:hypothetical protein
MRTRMRCRTPSVPAYKKGRDNIASPSTETHRSPVSLASKDTRRVRRYVPRTGGAQLDGPGSGECAEAVRGRWRRRGRFGRGGAAGIPRRGHGRPAVGPDDVGRREADEAGARCVGQGCGIHRSQALSRDSVLSSPASRCQ